MKTAKFSPANLSPFTVFLISTWLKYLNARVVISIKKKSELAIIDRSAFVKVKYFKKLIHKRLPLASYTTAKQMML